MRMSSLLNSPTIGDSVDYKKLDKYKRIVGKVTLDEQDICLKMIVDGMAWHYSEYEKEQSKTDRDLYREAEATAREMKIGLCAGLWQPSLAGQACQALCLRNANLRTSRRGQRLVSSAP